MAAPRFGAGFRGLVHPIMGFVGRVAAPAIEGVVEEQGLELFLIAAYMRDSREAAAPVRVGARGRGGRRRRARS
jgi:hypothetical protein